MDNYKTIEKKLLNLESFSGNTMSARAEHSRGRFEYKIYSYQTLVAVRTYDGLEGEWFDWLNPNKYSTTTSRHQNLIKRAWGVK